MTQSHPQLSFSSLRLSRITLPSAAFLAALLIMGWWMIKGADVAENSGRHTAMPDTVALTTDVVHVPEDAGETIQWRVASEQDIPFPLYPNATRYRIGGQNGLKLALFETTDEFGDVDHFYAEKATKTGLLRQQIMPDYVQYGELSGAQPAITEENPGVLIYAFFDAREAQQAGATPNARTSIIIIYR